MSHDHPPRASSIAGAFWFFAAATACTQVKAEHSGLLLRANEERPKTLAALLIQERRVLAAKTELVRCLQNRFKFTTVKVTRDDTATTFDVTVQNNLPVAVTGWQFDLASVWFDPEDRQFKNLKWPNSVQLAPGEAISVRAVGRALEFETPDTFDIEMMALDVTLETGAPLIQPIFDFLPPKVSSIEEFEATFHLLCSDA